MIIATAKQVIFLSILSATPIIWFRANRVDQLIELLRNGQYKELLDLLKSKEAIFKIVFTTGIALLVEGYSYLQLPLRLFVGWLPFFGRIDDLVAKCGISVGALAVIVSLVNHSE